MCSCSPQPCHACYYFSPINPLRSVRRSVLTLDRWMLRLGCSHGYSCHRSSDAADEVCKLNRTLDLIIKWQAMTSSFALLSGWRSSQRIWLHCGRHKNSFKTHLKAVTWLQIRNRNGSSIHPYWSVSHDMAIWFWNVKIEWVSHDMDIWS